MHIADTYSADETRALGTALGRALEPGDVVLLSGDLGAGKTQFTQGIAEGLGVAGVPISPTFNIVLSYEGGRLPLHHFDLYRLDELSQLDDIALREYLEAGGACVVEWAEKFPQAFDAYLHVEIGKQAEGARRVVAHAEGSRAEALLEAWRAQSGEGGAPDPVALGWPCAEGAPEGRGECPPLSGSEPVFARGDRALEQGLSAPVGSASPSPAHLESVGEYASGPYVLAFDTANEVVALGVGALDAETRTVRPVATRAIQAHRASNTTLVPAADALLAELGIPCNGIACVCAGRGPGSFTGVRIALAAAKGFAQALGVGLVGVSSLDAVAWGAWQAGVRGNLLVAADAMRKEVYPVRYALFADEVRRQGADRVVKAVDFAAELAAGAVGEAPSGEAAENSTGFEADAALAAECAAGAALDLLVTGDALVKYRDLLEAYGRVLPEDLWDVSGAGLLLALQDAWRRGLADPLDPLRHDPAFALPVYTRLSDAEENERIRLAKTDEKNLRTGVQDVTAPDGGKGRATMHAAAVLAAQPDGQGVAFAPLAAVHVPAVAQLEAQAMGGDAWGERLVADELGRRDRTWWVALAQGACIGYAGGLVVDGDLQILKVAVDPAWRRHGIARELLARVAEDARNLGAATCSLEVRVSNLGARAFYRALGLEEIGVRPHYYQDREDAAIMQGPLPVAAHDVAGMQLQHLAAHAAAFEHPLILAIESSCDETAAAVVDGAGNLLADVVASQVDFHARFGGVVPEIASRKHIEAICGVCAEALATAGVAWGDLDAVAATYAPGLLGALVVGVAYSKAAAWALDVPFIGANHLEGHLYANKIGCPDFAPPAVVSLVSGGNTLLVHMRGWGDYETLGATIDDAVGEAFDKVSKALGLGYPGGPVISKQAARGNPQAVDFPRALLHSHDYRFSLSGLKTAVVNYINGERAAGRPLNIPDIAASFQAAVVDVQVAKARTALRQTGAPTFCLGGGVAANPALRAAYVQMCAEEGVRLVMPPLASCGDNAGMVALVALDRYRAGRFFPLDADAAAHADLDVPY